MASHHIQEQPRAIVAIIEDLRHACRDERDALNDIATKRGSFSDTLDRAQEAEQRIETLREEFATVFVAANGMTVEQLRSAFSEALI